MTYISTNNADSSRQVNAKATKRQRRTGVLLATFIGLLSVPLYFVLIVYGLRGLSSHPVIPRTNEVWGCSSYKEACVGPQYSHTLVAVVAMVMIPIIVGWTSQRVAKFSCPKRAVILLAMYSSLVVIIGMALALVPPMGL